MAPWYMRIFTGVVIYFTLCCWAVPVALSRHVGNLTCVPRSAMSSRSSRCPPMPRPPCLTCRAGTPEVAAAFRPDFPSDWHGYMNDTTYFNLSCSVSILDLTNLGIRSIQTFLFNKDAIAVEEVRLEFNNLTFLRNGVFSDMIYPRLLNLSHNALESIESEVFDTLGREYCLQVVDLSHNHLLYMDGWPYFTQGNSLELFDVTHNMIRAFNNSANKYFVSDDYCQSGVCRKRIIDLQYNNFTSVDSIAGPSGLRVFTPELKLPYDLAFANLSIAKNNWICDCHMLVLRDELLDTIIPRHVMPECKYPLPLQGVSALDVPLDQFACNVSASCPPKCHCKRIPHLRRISVECSLAGLQSLPDELPDEGLHLNVNMEWNNVTVLEARDYLPRVTKLNLRGNGLVSVTERALNMLQTVSSLDLSLNELRTLDDDLLAIPFHAVNLTGNPLQCSCSLQWMALWARKNSELSCIHDGRRILITAMKETLDCGFPFVVPVAVSLSVLVFVVVTLAVVYRVWLRKKLAKWLFRVFPYMERVPQPMERGGEEEQAFDRIMYDVYLSFDEDDDVVRRWVKDYLLPALENERPQLSVYTRFRDSRPGSPIAEEIIQGQGLSRRLLVIISHNYCDPTKYNVFEFDSWIGEAGREAATPLLVLFQNVDERRITSNVVLRRLREAPGGQVFQSEFRHLIRDLKFALLRR